jgi:leucyl-tRNA synthetase
VKQGGLKMSKSRGNVTGPDELIAAYGADATRLYILFLGPADQDMDWTPEGVEGMARFVRRLWRAVSAAAEQPASPAGVDTPLARKAHETIARFSDDVGRRFVFNTPISAVMELINELSKSPDDVAARFAAETAVSLIQPYAPHVAEELWAKLGHETLWKTPWPVADDALLRHELVELVLQVNGKVRDRIQVPAGLSDDELVERARASERVQAHLNGEEQRVIVVPDKLVNIVV